MVAGQAVAFLPPDADAWAPRRIEERRRDEQAYEQRREELHREATLAREQVRRDIVTPPWMRTDPAAPRAMDAAGRPLPAPVEVRGDRGQKNSRLLVSILLLSLIGGVCGGVAWVTRER